MKAKEIFYAAATCLAMAVAFSETVEARPGIRNMIASIAYPPVRFAHMVAFHIEMSLLCVRRYVEPQAELSREYWENQK